MDRQSIVDLVLRDSQLLKVRAEREGVVAYTKRPSMRARPNLNFLSNTIHSVSYANRVVQRHIHPAPAEVTETNKKHKKKSSKSRESTPEKRSDTHLHSRSKGFQELQPLHEQHAFRSGTGNMVARDEPKHKPRDAQTARSNQDRREEEAGRRSSAERRVRSSGEGRTRSNGEERARESVEGRFRSDGEGRMRCLGEGRVRSSGEGSGREEARMREVEQREQVKEEQWEQNLVNKVKRGRGGVGPRADMPGPYLERPSSSRHSTESTFPLSQGTIARRKIGPTMPTY
mmetsp:Transcript_18173/g.25155  ORF Transcript_18173/g.25155 Transcript_18173/m.25155 type:complete len:287 (-) Transcript_18173:221-1081(-)|eukprot:CAMPEP_0196592068 /NCGR_PEP_ID=MMETSP1081-20130531/71716_1 /TAXON_ID=36882 /ORGANISM="Pyramimonas amylifera, Strain CCMP720" /LENGTH=286 /DNA_ID=CAMNT_0041915639 /DNA_START=68 /DNA_END=928 /DNA_ORIENTATION=-